jgi:hypothetical protein
MDERDRARLLAALDQDDRIRGEETQRNEQRQRQLLDIHKKWKELYENELKSGLDEVMTTLRNRGWQADTRNVPGGFEVSVWRDDMRAGASSVRPFVRFAMGDKAEAVSVHVGTLEKSGDPGGSAKAVKHLDELTAAYVEGEVIGLVEQLVKKLAGTHRG